MKTRLAILVCLVLGTASALLHKRTKRQAYELPDGAELLVGSYSTGFSCQSDGYYADTDNDCRIFHVCHTQVAEDGTPELRQWSFVCGNQTVFNQAFLICAHPEESIPCSSSSSFYYLNERIGDEKALFLNDQDVQNAVQLIPAYSGAEVVRPAQPTGGRRPPGRG